jgi:predicted regulator of Ras-like GTPase activity (Roadblock/LC7/MglB family)
MGKIQDALAGLRSTPGVKGVALLTADGLVAAADLDAACDAEALAGLASYLMTSTNRALQEGAMGPCARVTIQASNGKAQIVEMTESSLVVLFDQFADLGAARRPVDEAVARIRRLASLK